MARRAQRSFKVCPLSARSRSSSSRRLASANALNTASRPSFINTICNLLVACQAANRGMRKGRALLRDAGTEIVGAGLAVHAGLMGAAHGAILPRFTAADAGARNRRRQVRQRLSGLRA